METRVPTSILIENSSTSKDNYGTLPFDLFEKNDTTAVVDHIQIQLTSWRGDSRVTRLNDDEGREKLQKVKKTVTISFVENERRDDER